MFTNPGNGLQNDGLRMLAAVFFFLTLSAVASAIEPPKSVGPGSYAGDGGPAVDARLNNPRGIAFDKEGNLFISDSSNNRIRKIDAQTGIITTVAGTGEREFSGDGKPALEAELSFPHALTFDRAGNLYFTDSGNHRVRKIDTAGIITTVVGSGKTEPATDVGKSLKANLSFPRGVAVDDEGSMYVADTGHAQIMKTRKDGKIGMICGGNPVDLRKAGMPVYLRTPAGTVIGPDGQIYWADSILNRVKKVNPLKKDPATRLGWVTIVAGAGDQGIQGDQDIPQDNLGNQGAGGDLGDGGLALDANLSEPAALAFDRKGNLYIADHGNSRIRMVDANTGNISTVAGNGKRGFSGDGGLAVNAQLNSPAGLAVDGNGALYIADASNNRIRKVDLVTGIITTVAGSGPTDQEPPKSPLPGMEGRII